MKPLTLILIIVTTLVVMALVIFNYLMQPNVLPSTEYFKAFRASRNTNQKPVDLKIASTTPPVPTNTNTRPSAQSQEAVDSVKVYAASTFGVHENDVIVLSAVAKEWPDSCLGTAGPEEMCLQVLTQGYEVAVIIEGRTVYYRTNSDGTVIRMALESAVEETDEFPGFVKLHRSCTQDSDCDSGVECVSYYGFAGPQGSRFATCEIPCSSDSQCANGLRCSTIPDGPASVCY